MNIVFSSKKIDKKNCSDLKINIKGHEINILSLYSPEEMTISGLAFMLGSAEHELWMLAMDAEPGAWNKIRDGYVDCIKSNLKKWNVEL